MRERPRHIVRNYMLYLSAGTVSSFLVGCTTKALQDSQQAAGVSIDLSMLGQIISMLSIGVAVFAFIIRWNNQQNKAFEELRLEHTKMKKDLEHILFRLNRTERDSVTPDSGG